MASSESTTLRRQTDGQATVAQKGKGAAGVWPPRPAVWPEVMTPTEAAQYLRLDETGRHTPKAAARTLNYWRDRGELRATRYARSVWFLKCELDRFLQKKTEE